MNKLERLRAIIADDSLAISFQSMGQYRTMLLKAIDNQVAEVNKLAVADVSGLLPKEQNDKEWELLKKELNTNNWNAGEETTFYGFFLHGWLGRFKQGCWQ